MKNQDWLALIITSGVIIYWLNEDQKKNKQIRRLNEGNQRLRSSYLKQQEQFREFQQQLLENINQRDDLTEGIKKQISGLVEKYRFIDGEVTRELISASSLIEINEPTKAIATLTKIIENLLKKLFKNDSEFHSKLGLDKTGKHFEPRLVEYLRFAKDKNLLNDEEFQFASGLRMIRNEEAHQLDVKKEKNLACSAFLTAISIILKIHNFSISFNTK